MKKKLLALPLLSLFCLTSCGESSMYGTYSFKMGRSGAGETRVGLSINLLDKASTDQEAIKVGGKVFELTLETDQMEKPYSLGGYYTYDTNTKRVKLNAIIEIPGEETKITIPGELLQYIAVTYLNNDEFTLKMPVSMPINPLDPTDIDIGRILDNDLLHQLVWYGFYFDLDAPKLYWDLRKINYDPDGEPNKIPIPGENLKDTVEQRIEKKLGTHPRVENEEDQIYTYNYIFKDIFSNARFYEKDVDGNFNLIGSLDKQTPIGKDDIYYFTPLAGKKKPEDGKCYIKDGYLGLTKTEATITYVPGTDQISTLKIGEGEDIKKEYFDSYGSFTFRDYHEIKIGLRKE